MEPPELRSTTETRLERIAWLSSRDSEKVFGQLMHHFNEGSLEVCFHELDGKKAVGIDGIKRSQYAENLTENLKELVQRMKRMAYRPEPIREVLIPKEGGKAGAVRPLGISNFEDKLVQKMMHKVLESIYEPLFLNCSYGFRPGRGCHGAIRALHQYLYANEVETVIDVDLSNFFGTANHKIMEEILREKIKDQKFMRYVIRMFKAGVLAADELTISDEGVAQGSACSPIISNILAHEVIDKWFQETVKKHCAGKVELFRYADDMVVCCQYAKDAERIQRALAQRLNKYKLRLNEDKTQCVSFSKKQHSQNKKQGKFSFLGFTFYLGRSKGGIIIPKLRTDGKRLRSKLVKVTDWIKGVRNKAPLKEIWEIFCAKLRGHIKYYGVSFNGKSIRLFLNQAKRIIFKWLNRRSQKKSFNWDKYRLFVGKHPLPQVKIYVKLF
ncbi:MAG: group II intron reverse transcriptase/maturase [Parachlamydiaceae bacterium]|nr:group II intron reverse transcriptase/maturase [Parachlamydiaceae bacterium]